MELRNWCFTIRNGNNEINDNRHKQLEQLSTTGTATYLIYRFDKGYRETWNLQGFVRFGERMRFKTVKRLLPQGAHIEAATVKAQEAAKYCKSGEGLFIERGAIPESNNSSAFKEFKKFIKKKYRHNRIEWDV